MWWHRFCPDVDRGRWTATLRALGERDRAFPGDAIPAHHAARIQEVVERFSRETALFDPSTLAGAGAYLVSELTGGADFGISGEADRAASDFANQLAARGAGEALEVARRTLSTDPAREFELVRDWVRGHLGRRSEVLQWLDETAVRVFLGGDWIPRATGAAGTMEITGCRGSHARIVDGTCRVDLLDLRSRLARFHDEASPRFAAWQARKQALLEAERARLRLEEFRPRVLTSFVRNQLIDEVYLPLVGDNLAKQVGAAGDRKRTDLMGLLLLISPPGYGKTTLLEYLASRL